MDVFDASDVNEESQPTQLLQELLDHNSSPFKRPSESRSSTASKVQAVHANEISSDSLPSSRTSNSLPHYHFHGLASTQTQSHHQEEAEQVNEGSQKENIGTSKPTKDFEHSNPSPISRPSSPYPSSSRNVQTKTTRSQVRGPATPIEKKTNDKASTTVSFQSPRVKPPSNVQASKPVTRPSPYKPTATTSRYNPVRRRSSSEDSFAQDPELDKELFVARSKQLNIPISELARDSSEHDPRSAMTDNPNSSMFPRRSGGRVPQVLGEASYHGRVLVEATPSQSGSSQNESQNMFEHLAETQMDEEREHGQSHNPISVGRSDDIGYQSSENSFSYRRPLTKGNDMDSGPEQQLEATQPSTQLLEETQPTTQLEDSDRITPLTMQSPFSVNPSHAAVVSTSNTVSRPRLVTSLVDPRLWYRYGNYSKKDDDPPSGQARNQNIQSTNDSSFPDSKAHGTDSEAFSPSLDVAAPSDAIVGQSNTSSAVEKRGLGRNILSGTLSPQPMDVDVVPDSEPLRVDPNPTTKRMRNAPLERQPDNYRQPKVNTVRPKVVNMCPPSQSKGQPVSEEDEVPLAEVAAKRPRGRPPKNPLNKSKGKVVDEASPTVRANAAMAAVPVSKERKGQSTTRGQKRVTGGSWETGVVPSSVPEQDEAPALRNNLTRTSNVDLLTMKAPNSRQSSRSTSTAPKLGSKQQADPVFNPDDDVLEETETAEDDDEDKAPGPSRKRKRVTQTKVPAMKNIRSAAKRKRETATPDGGRQVKKLRSTNSTATKLTNALGTRVFALWKQDGHYYPGTVHSAEPNAQYLIHFYDDTSSKVMLKQLRLCRVQVGDQVIVGSDGHPTNVLSVENDGEDTTVRVKINDVVEQAPLEHLRIASKTIECEWNDRMLTADSISTTIKPVKPKLSPSPSKMSVASLPSVQGTQKRFLSEYGFIITLSAVDEKREKEKDKIVSAIRRSGGMVVDDISNIIRMEGRHSSHNNRWIIKKDDVRWVGDGKIKRLFLLADECNQKPKYLIALALGIPCLSVTWLHDSVENNVEKNWSGYLLPQGFSYPLGARLSQQVDLNWGNSSYQLDHIMSNMVPHKVFADKSVLCVGPEMVCQPKGKRKKTIVDDKQQQAAKAIPQIIIAMGADSVEAVTDLRYATRQLKEYDYLVIMKKEEYVPQFSGCKTVDWDWVKECLFASRYVPTPSWNDEGSQKA